MQPIVFFLNFYFPAFHTILFCRTKIASVLGPRIPVEKNEHPTEEEVGQSFRATYLLDLLYVFIALRADCVLKKRQL